MSLLFGSCRFLRRRFWRTQLWSHSCARWEIRCDPRRPGILGTARDVQFLSRLFTCPSVCNILGRRQTVEVRSCGSSCSRWADGEFFGHTAVGVMSTGTWPPYFGAGPWCGIARDPSLTSCQNHNNHNNNNTPPRLASLTYRSGSVASHVLTSVGDMAGEAWS